MERRWRRGAALPPRRQASPAATPKSARYNCPHSPTSRLAACTPLPSPPNHHHAIRNAPSRKTRKPGPTSCVRCARCVSRSFSRPSPSDAGTPTSLETDPGSLWPPGTYCRGIHSRRNLKVVGWRSCPRHRLPRPETAARIAWPKQREASRSPRIPACTLIPSYICATTRQPAPAGEREACSCHLSFLGSQSEAHLQDTASVLRL